MDGQALIDTVEGGHKEIENILQWMREIAIQSANDTNDDSDRDNLNAEMKALTIEIDRAASVTTWAGQTMMSSAGSSFSFQVGTATGGKNQIFMTINSMSTSGLCIDGTGTLTAANIVPSTVGPVHGTVDATQTVFTLATTGATAGTAAKFTFKDAILPIPAAVASIDTHSANITDTGSATAKTITMTDPTAEASITICGIVITSLAVTAGTAAENKAAQAAALAGAITSANRSAGVSATYTTGDNFSLTLPTPAVASGTKHAFSSTTTVTSTTPTAAENAVMGAEIAAQINSDATMVTLGIGATADKTTGVVTLNFKTYESVDSKD